MSGGGGGDDDFAVEEEHENHERYLVTYADMITLLMALFVILYAMGGPPQEDDYSQFARGAATEIIHPLDGGIGIWRAGASEAPPEAVTYVDQEASPREVDAAHASDLARQLEGSATGDAGVSGGTGSGTGEGYGIDSTVDERGVVLTLPDDALLFDAGSAEIGQRGVAILQQVAEVLKGTTNQLLIEGHTDSRPIPGDSNWALSSRRAASVAEVLIAAGIDPERLVVEGYADTHPVADNGTEAGRRRNRRVELVVTVQFSGAAPTTLVLAEPDVIGDPITDEDIKGTPTTAATRTSSTRAHETSTPDH
ncbi:MAG: OmpA family protein [Acidimicrobiales bacterium]